MGKQAPETSDEATLKKKVGARLVGSEGSEDAPALRRLRKRLKRAQRKRRRLKARKRRAVGENSGAQSEAPTGT